MSVINHNGSVMDDYEALDAFAAHADTQSISRFLDELRDTPSIISGLNFLASDRQERDRMMRVLSGRLLEERANMCPDAQASGPEHSARIKEWYAILSLAEAMRHEEVTNVVRHHAYEVLNRDALEALSLRGEHGAHMVLKNPAIVKV